RRPAFLPKPHADGTEVAMVVGPAGEEIFTNKLGQVSIHFHWNKHDVGDERASCWVRLAMGWSGDGYGVYAVLRIGQEGVISYLDGDIDRSLVTGCVYNGNVRMPIDLPKNKTQTVFRTKTHKDEGYNELRFEDAAGKEFIALHAEKDMD